MQSSRSGYSTNRTVAVMISRPRHVYFMLPPEARLGRLKTRALATRNDIGAEMTLTFSIL